MATDDVAAQLAGLMAAQGLQEEKPLAAEEIEEALFALAKEGFNGTVAVSPAQLQTFLLADPGLITVRDEKGWTPLLWAAFSGHAQVRCGRCSTKLPQTTVAIGVPLIAPTPAPAAGCRADAGEWRRCTLHYLDERAEGGRDGGEGRGLRLGIPLPRQLSLALGLIQGARARSYCYSVAYMRILSEHYEPFCSSCSR